LETPACPAGQAGRVFLQYGYFTTLPPAVLHASIEATLTQPCPLQPFNPLHELLAVLHSDLPLQLLALAHFTSALSIMSAEIAGALTANKLAAAAATATPVLMFIMLVLQIGYKKKHASRDSVAPNHLPA
jgi:hypothetical protein